MDNDTFMVGNPEWANQTIVHPIGLLAILICGFSLLVLPRKWAVLPMLVIACFIPSAQRVVILGCDFNFLRIMIIFGYLRLILLRDYRYFKWLKLDKVVFSWAFIAAIVGMIRLASFSAIINRLGFLFDVLGFYFFFRCVIHDINDVKFIIISAAIIGVPVATFFLLEKSTGRNVFSIFGGVPPITMVRDGKLRCQGAFSHPILAGCFWVSFLPLFISLWFIPKIKFNRLMSLASVCCVLIIIIACSASTPLFGLIGAICGWLVLRFRFQMKLIRWAIFAGLVFLHFAREKPVWSLLARVSSLFGGSGWHRYKVIDAAIEFFDEWWLLGTKYIGHWGVWAGDITNQYVAEGINGGLISLILFIYIFVIAFSYVGQLWRYNGLREWVMVIWGLGVTIFVHLLNFLGVCYFGQTIIVWYLHLAAIASSYQFCFERAPSSSRERKSG